MSVLLLVLTDGRRNCIEQTIPHALRRLDGAVTRKVIHDDSGDTDYQTWLATAFPGFEIIRTPARAGFGGAIETAWTYLRLTAERDDCRFVFHLEDDFIIERDVPLTTMSQVLDMHPKLVQLALVRQPWNDEERAAGGLLDAHPGAFTPRGATWSPHARWLEHRLWFTTNPSLYRRSLCWRGWPTVDRSEGIFTHQLLEDPAVRFGYWGDTEWVTHIGTERIGQGY